MEKIYNNLNIENLTKTEWFNLFNKSQQNEIYQGLEQKLDVLIYAKPGFDYRQMGQIRLGLEFDLDVSIYAKSEFDYEQMWEIRLGLQDKLNVSIYAKPEYPWRIMTKKEYTLKVYFLFL